MKCNLEKQQLVRQWMIEKSKTCSESTLLARLAATSFHIYTNPKWLDEMAVEIVESQNAMERSR